MLRSRLLIPLLTATCAVLLLPAAASAAFGPLDGINPVGGGPTDTTYQLDYPSSVVRVPDGADYSFFVVDAENHRIVKLDSAGKFLFAFGGLTGSATQMFAPRSIAYGGGFLYVATNGYFVRKYTLTGQNVAEWGGYNATATDGKFASVGGIAYDPAWGQIYVVDQGHNRIQWFDDDGTFRGKMGVQGSGSGQFFFPRDLAFGDGGQRLFVLDGGNSRIQYFDRQGSNPSFTFSYAGSFGNSSTLDPAGVYNAQSITVDRSPLSGHGDRIYVTLGEPSNKIKVFEGSAISAPPFTPTFSWGGTGSADGQFNNPSDVFVEGTTAYVAEGQNNRLTSFTGLPTAATPGTAWGRDPKLDGYLQSGSKAAVAPDGSVYVVDSIKTRIQRFAPNGGLIAAWGSVGIADGQFESGGISSVAVEPNGNVLVSDSMGRDIQRFNPNGAFIGAITWTPISPATTIAPGPIRTDADGTIFVYDYDALKLVELSSSGAILSSFGETGTSHLGNFIYQLNDLAVSPNGDTIYIQDYVRVKKFTRTAGTWSGHPASQSHLGSGTGQLQFGNAYSINIDPTTNDLLVADSTNNRIQRISETNDVYTWLATYGTIAGGFNATEFIRPNAVVVDTWGNMSVVDGGSDSVKRYGDAPVVTIDSPLAGTSTVATSVPVSFSSTDPGADCDFVSGSSVVLNLGSNTIVVSCSNQQGSDSASVTITRGTAPSVTITQPAADSSTTAGTSSLAWTTTGTGPITCTVDGVTAASPISIPLALGANNISVSCTNTFGSDTASLVVTRTSPALQPGNTPPGPQVDSPGAAEVSINLAKKLKLTKSKKLKLSVTCPDGCTVTSKLVFGKQGSRVKQIRVAAMPSRQSVTIKLSSAQYKMALAAFKKKKSVTITVAVQSYKATQGKTGKAKVSK